jgi:hypothetical protein
MAYEGSYLWQLRQVVGQRLLLMPGAEVVVVDSDGETPESLQPQTEAVWEMYAAYRAAGLFQAR